MLSKISGDPFGVEALAFGPSPPGLEDLPLAGGIDHRLPRVCLGAPSATGEPRAPTQQLNDSRSTSSISSRVSRRSGARSGEGRDRETFAPGAP